MNLRRVLALPAIALLAAGCGGGDDDAGSGGDDGGKARSSETASEDEQPVPDSPDDRIAATSAFALTPAIETCMTDAGFTQDAPPTGGLAAWRHPSGGRVVVASGGDVTIGIASEIGTAERPANVDGDLVVAASEAESAAARACLE